MTPQSTFVIREARPTDASVIMQFVYALAEASGEAAACTGSVRHLHEHLFGDRPYAEALIAEVDGDPVGYAMFFPTYSTFTTQPSLYVEDLFVTEAFRSQGIGQALMDRVAAIAAERGYGRLAWVVREWNARAIAFYEQRVGARLQEALRVMEVPKERCDHARA